MPGTLEDYAAAVNHAISVCRDAEQGFRGAANAARESALKNMFEQYSTLHGRLAAELQEAVKALGFEPHLPAGVGGMLYAGWIKLKAALDGHDSHSILVEAERCEEWCVNRYRDALATNLPIGIRSVLEAQYERVQAVQNQVRNRRAVMAWQSSIPATDD
jgi:uncharacterized protein (TIGR02284 family)